MTSVVSAESSLVTFVSTLPSSGNDGVLSGGAAVVVFVVFTSSFSNVTCAVVVSLSSVVKFSVASIVFTGENMPAVSFSLRVVIEVSSATVVVVELTVLETSTFVLTAVTASVETASVSLVAVFTGALVITSVVPTSSGAFVAVSVATDVVDASVFFRAAAAVVKGVVV